MPESSGKTLQNEISIYRGTLTTKTIVECSAVVQKAFPALPLGFFDVFTDRLKENGFCDDRLKDSVNHVIDTCIYPTPTIAQFISWDRRFKFFRYDEMLKKESWSGYESVKLPDREAPVWVHVDDIREFKLQEFIIKPK